MFYWKINADLCFEKIVVYMPVILVVTLLLIFEKGDDFISNTFLQLFNIDRRVDALTASDIPPQKYSIIKGQVILKDRDVATFGNDGATAHTASTVHWRCKWIGHRYPQPQMWHFLVSKVTPSYPNGFFCGDISKFAYTSTLHLISKRKGCIRDDISRFSSVFYKNE